MKLSRDKIQRMIDVGSGGSSGGVSSSELAGLLAGYATESWVDEHYISIDFFSRLFQAHGTENGSEIDVIPNDMDTVITSVESMFGFWTNLYISALGSNGAAPAGISLGMLTDVNISGTPSAGQVLTFDAVTQKWVNSNAQAGATTIANLTDVTLTSLQNGQTLLYDSTTSKWYNSALKTINGQSLLGSGDISVGGGASGNYLPLTGGTLSQSYGRIDLLVNTNNHIRSGLSIRTPANELVAVLSSESTNPSSASHGYFELLGGGVSWCRFQYGYNSYINVGNFGLGTDSPSQKLDVQGNIQIGNGTQGLIGHRYSSSDANIYNYILFRNGVPTDNSGAIEYHAGFDTRAARPAHVFNVMNENLNAVNALVIQNNTGYVGILNNTPEAPLHVNGECRATYIHFNGSDAGIDPGWAGRGSSSNNNLAIHATYDLFFSAGGTNAVVSLLRQGYVGINTYSPSYSLHVAGTIYATGAITALSDARKKDITGEAEVSVEQIAHAPAVQFLWKDKEHRKDGQQVGTLAQYWKTVLPEVVIDKGGELSMQYGVAALVSTIITARKVVDHERRIHELEKENERLKKEISQLRLN